MGYNKHTQALQCWHVTWWQTQDWFYGEHDRRCFWRQSVGYDQVFYRHLNVLSWYYKAAPSRRKITRAIGKPRIHNWFSPEYLIADNHNSWVFGSFCFKALLRTNVITRFLVSPAGDYWSEMLSRITSSKRRITSPAQAQESVTPDPPWP